VIPGNSPKSVTINRNARSRWIGTAGHDASEYTDETASKRRHNDVTVFIDMDRKKEPVLFVTPGRGKNTLREFATFLSEHGGDPATAWRIKEKLAWIRKARTPRAARWRITHFLNWASALVGDTPGLEPMRKALATLKNQIDRVVQRWTSTDTNARLEGMNGLVQTARARARGYRNTDTFITMIYLIGSPAGSILKST